VSVAWHSALWEIADESRLMCFAPVVFFHAPRLSDMWVINRDVNRPQHNSAGPSAGRAQLHGR